MTDVWEQARLRLQETYETLNPWPLHAQVYEFMDTPHFRNAPRVGVGADKEILAEVRAFDVGLREGELTDARLRPALSLLARHIITRGPSLVYRWWPQPRTGLHSMQNIRHAIVIAQRDAKPDIEWNTYLRAAWSCTQLKMVAESDLLWTRLVEWIEAEVSTSPHGFARTRLTVLNGMVAHCVLAGDRAREDQVRAEILKLWEPVWYYLGRNRIVESAVETFRHSPTPNNRATVLRLVQEQRRAGEAHEPTECVRESLLVLWMVWRYLLAEGSSA